MEYIPSHIFEAAKEDRKISGRGSFILIFHPLAAENSQPYWRQRDPTKEVDNQLVPAGYEVKVIDGRIKMTR
jgi:hypothetical protein